MRGSSCFLHVKRIHLRGGNAVKVRTPVSEVGGADSGLAGPPPSPDQPQITPSSPSTRAKVRPLGSTIIDPPLGKESEAQEDFERARELRARTPSEDC